jgi:hypothetical protein
MVGGRNGAAAWQRCGGTAPRQDGFQQGGGNVLEDDRGEARSTAGMMDCKNG